MRKGSNAGFVCRFSDAGMMLYLRAEAAGGRKAPRHEVAGSWAVAGSKRYGDCMSALLSMVGATAAPDDVYVCVQGSPGECNGHLGGHAECINGRWVD